MAKTLSFSCRVQCICVSVINPARDVRKVFATFWEVREEVWILKGYGGIVLGGRIAGGGTTKRLKIASAMVLAQVESMNLVSD
jgi:hypothetical protein